MGQGLQFLLPRGCRLRPPGFHPGADCARPPSSRMPTAPAGFPPGCRPRRPAFLADADSAADSDRDRI